MGKVIAFSRISDSNSSRKVKPTTSIRQNMETKVISINSKNGMTDKQSYEKILNLYNKDF